MAGLGLVSLRIFLVHVKSKAKTRKGENRTASGRDAPKLPSACGSDAQSAALQVHRALARDPPGLTIRRRFPSASTGPLRETKGNRSRFRCGFLLRGFFLFVGSPCGHRKYMK